VMWWCRGQKRFVLVLLVSLAQSWWSFISIALVLLISNVLIIHLSFGTDTSNCWSTSLYLYFLTYLFVYEDSGVQKGTFFCKNASARRKTAYHLPFFPGISLHLYYHPW
jgi:hypothetical protein